MLGTRTIEFVQNNIKDAIVIFNEDESFNISGTIQDSRVYSPDLPEIASYVTPCLFFFDILSQSWYLTDTPQILKSETAHNVFMNNKILPCTVKDTISGGSKHIWREQLPLTLPFTNWDNNRCEIIIALLKSDVPDKLDVTDLVNEFQNFPFIIQCLAEYKNPGTSHRCDLLADVLDCFVKLISKDPIVSDHQYLTSIRVLRNSFEHDAIDSWTHSNFLVIFPHFNKENNKKDKVFVVNRTVASVCRERVKIDLLDKTKIDELTNILAKQESIHDSKLKTFLVENINMNAFQNILDYDPTYDQEREVFDLFSKTLTAQHTKSMSYNNLSENYFAALYDLFIQNKFAHMNYPTFPFETDGSMCVLENFCFEPPGTLSIDSTEILAFKKIVDNNVLLTTEEQTIIRMIPLFYMFYKSHDMNVDDKERAIINKCFNLLNAFILLIDTYPSNDKSKINKQTHAYQKCVCDFITTIKNTKGKKDSKQMWLEPDIPFPTVGVGFAWAETRTVCALRMEDVTSLDKDKLDQILTSLNQKSTISEDLTRFLNRKPYLEMFTNLCDEHESSDRILQQFVFAQFVNLLTFQQNIDGIFNQKKKLRFKRLVEEFRKSISTLYHHKKQTQSKQSKYRCPDFSYDLGNDHVMNLLLTDIYDLGVVTEDLTLEENKTPSNSETDSPKD